MQGEKIKFWLQCHCISQRALAEAAGLPQTQISAVLSKSEHVIATLERLGCPRELLGLPQNDTDRLFTDPRNATMCPFE